MARMPGARWQGEHSPKTPMQRYDIVCVHTIVGYAPAHAAHFSVHGTGAIDQSRDTRYRSAANLNGNHRVIAIENEDHGSPFPNWNTRDGHAVPGFTSEQVEANAKILAWAHEEHGVPLQLAPNSKPGSRGLAYHRQGCDGNFSGYDYPGRVSGGELWSSSYGKVCPGDRRISRLDDILKRAKQIVNGDDDDMTAPKDWDDRDWEAFRKKAGWGFENPTNSTLYGTMVRENYEHWTEPLGTEDSPGQEKSVRTMIARGGASYDVSLAILDIVSQGVDIDLDEQAVANRLAPLLLPALITAAERAGAVIPQETLSAALRDVLREGVVGS